MSTKGFRLADFAPEFQQPARSLILAGLAEHWGEIDPALNNDLDDIATSYEHGRTLVILRGSTVVATGTLVLEPATDTSPPTAEIVRMSVASDFRRAGLGRWMVDELIETARRSGVERVVLETTATWDAVRSFYESCGFVVTHFDAGPFGDDVWFELVLG